jgi:nucleoside-diphosphate-sugar epimerase
MRALLTGGSGDIGQTLVPRLLDKGDTPVILDLRAPGDLQPGAVRYFCRTENRRLWYTVFSHHTIV